MREFTPAFKLFIAAVAVGVLIIVPIFSLAATLSKDEQKVCAEEGGCAVISRQKLSELVKQAFEDGKRYSDVTCGKRTGYPFDNFRDGEFHGTRR